MAWIKSQNRADMLFMTSMRLWYIKFERDSDLAEEARNWAGLNCFRSLHIDFVAFKFLTASQIQFHLSGCL